MCESNEREREKERSKLWKREFSLFIYGTLSMKWVLEPYAYPSLKHYVYIYKV